MSFPFKSSLDITKLDTRFGIDTGQSLVTWISNILHHQQYTFKDIEDKFQKKLVIVATNISCREPVYFSAETTPEFSVGLACRMSCSIPLLFAAVKYNGHIYVDGALTDNFAWQKALELADGDKHKVLGIQCNPDPETCHEYDEIKGLEDFLSAIVDCCIRSTGTPPPGLTILKLKISLPLTVSLMRFTLPPKVLHSLYEEGHCQATLYLKKLK
jgi:predicted acylesterase/phospholipase RssA